jgi:hypothetical protein
LFCVALAGIALWSNQIKIRTSFSIFFCLSAGNHTKQMFQPVFIDVSGFLFSKVRIK